VRTLDPVAAEFAFRTLLSNNAEKEIILDIEPVILDRVIVSARVDKEKSEGLHTAALSEFHSVASHSEFPIKVVDERD